MLFQDPLVTLSRDCKYVGQTSRGLILPVTHVLQGDNPHNLFTATQEHIGVAMFLTPVAVPLQYRAGTQTVWAAHATLIIGSQNCPRKSVH